MYFCNFVYQFSTNQSKNNLSKMQVIFVSNLEPRWDLCSSLIQNVSNIYLFFFRNLKNMLQPKEGVNQEIGRNNIQEIRYLAEGRNYGKYQDENECYFYTVIFPDQSRGIEVWKIFPRKWNGINCLISWSVQKYYHWYLLDYIGKSWGKKWSWVYIKLSKWKNESVTNQAKNNVMG